MAEDFETWIIETGDAIIQKQSEQGKAPLSPIEQAVYCLWVIDYAVRNS